MSITGKGWLPGEDPVYGGEASRYVTTLRAGTRVLDSREGRAYTGPGNAGHGSV